MAPRRPRHRSLVVVAAAAATSALTAGHARLFPSTGDVQGQGHGDGNALCPRPQFLDGGALFPGRTVHSRLRCTAGREGDKQGEEPGQTLSESTSSVGGLYAKRPGWRQRFRRVMPFVEARRCAQSMGLSGKGEWDEWVAEGKKSPFLGPYMPSNPDEMYAEEWRGWDDFLGVLLDFESARKVVANLHLSGQEEWYNFVDEDAVRLQELRLPSRPRTYYSDSWRGYDHWLGLPDEPLCVPSHWTQEYGREHGEDDVW